MYKVIKYFTDLQDNDYPYDMGDVFPRSSVTVTKGRLAELAGEKNKQGTPLIRFVGEKEEEEKEEKPAKK